MRGLGLINANHQPWLRIFHVPVRAHDARGVLTNLLELLRHLLLPMDTPRLPASAPQAGLE